MPDPQKVPERVIARAKPEAISLFLERRSVASAFLQGDEVPKRGRLLRFARNDEYTVS